MHKWALLKKTLHLERNHHGSQNENKLRVKLQLQKHQWTNACVEILQQCLYRNKATTAFNRCSFVSFVPHHTEEAWTQKPPTPAEVSRWISCDKEWPEEGPDLCFTHSTKMQHFPKQKMCKVNIEKIVWQHPELLNGQLCRTNIIKGSHYVLNNHCK